MREKFFLLARYGIGGLVGAFVQIALLYVWVTLLGLEDWYLLGLALGFIAALASSFALQKYWAFRDKEGSRAPGQLLSYAAVALSGLALNALILMAARALFETQGLDFFRGWYLAVQTAAVLIVAASNFLLNYFFTFRAARKERSWEQPPSSSV